MRTHLPAGADPAAVGPLVRLAARLGLASLLLLATAPPLAAQVDHGGKGVSRETLDRARRMLATVQKDVRKYYFDSTFRGLDLDARFKEAEARLASAPTNNHLWAIIAQVLAELNDSHTNFYPPSHAAQVEYGFSMQFVGDSCYVVGVKPGSDAEKKGVRPGDQVLGIDAYRPDRRSFWTVQYVYHTLSPRPGMHLKLRGPDGVERELDAMAHVEMGERIVDFTNAATISRLIMEYDAAGRRPTQFYRSLGDSVLIWRMPRFLFDDQRNIDEMIDRARKHRALILDLRNNPGGAVVTELHLLGRLFNREVRIGERRTREGTEAVVVAPGKDPYLGLLVILVNSGSASAAEITARATQLEGRAIIVGDRTMGAVVTSRMFMHEVGHDRRVSYGASITVADVVACVVLLVVTISRINRRSLRREVS